MSELDRPCLGREAELDLGLRALELQGSLWITGAPGIGKTHVATALSARLSGPGVIVSLAGCAGRADVVRAFGDAIGVFPCGDESAVRAGAGARWVLADDVSASTCEALLGLELQGPLILIGAGLSEPAAGVSGTCIMGIVGAEEYGAGGWDRFSIGSGINSREIRTFPASFPL